MFSNGKIKIILLVTQYVWYFTAARNPVQPHIIFIIADDLGWNDVGFRGSNQIPTPNIDALAYNGIVLNRHYTLPCCSPSRAALLTGKYPIRMGLHGFPIIAGHADGMPLDEVLLPEYLQKLGYITRLIGKWHLGTSKTSMTPTYRGFHSHFGYYNGYVGYKNGIHDWMKFSPFEGGVRGMSIAWSPLFKDLRRSSEEYMHISDWLPTLFSAAGGNADLLEGLDGVNHWDYLIGKDTKSPRNELLVNILEEVGDWAIIKDKWKLVQVNATRRHNMTQLYLGESGRDAENYSMNLVTTSRVSQILRRNQPSDILREEYLERRATLDMTSACADRIAAAASNSTDPFIPPDRCHQKPCLFNIHMDPCEFHDVAEQHPSVVDALQELVKSYASEVVPVQDHGFDPASHPRNWDGWWAPWLDGSEGRGKGMS